MKLSIITVARNALPALKETISAIAEASIRDLELIVVDGASTDGTPEYLAGLQSKIVRYVSEPDTGIYNAMNKGIRMASGEFVYFLNAGDRLTSLEALEFAMRSLGSGDVYYCDVLLNENEMVRLQKYYKQLSLAFWLREHMCHQAVFFRREMFTDLGLYEEGYRFAADYDVLLHAWVRGKKFEHVDVAIATYDMHGVSSQRQNHPKVLREYKLIQERRLGFTQKIYNFILKVANDWSPQGSSLPYRIQRKLLREILAPFFYYRHSHQFYFGKSATPRPLRVAHINTYSANGGAAVASLRLHGALQDHGVLSQHFSLNTHNADRTIPSVKHRSRLRRMETRVRMLLENLALRLSGTRRPGLNSFGLTTQMDVDAFFKVMELFDPDVIHLHWIGHYFLRIQDLKRLNKPIVWTFHDMWPMLGLQHLSLNDAHLRGFEEHADDSVQKLDRFIWNLKVKHWKPLLNTMHIICPSEWMRQQALKSPLWSGAEIDVIGNSIPSDILRPMDRKMARGILGIPETMDAVFIFGAAAPFVEPVKGYGVFMRALERFADGRDRSKIAVITFGQDAGKYMVPGVLHFHFDFIRALEFLRVAYSAADLLVVASDIESFCLVAGEAQSCGVPVACFDTAGLRDVVDHQVSGYRAQPGSADDLANAFKWILEDPERYQKLSAAARARVTSLFDAASITQKHLGIYDRLLEKVNGSRPRCIPAQSSNYEVKPVVIKDKPRRPLSGDTSALRSLPADLGV